MLKKTHAIPYRVLFWLLLGVLLLSLLPLAVIGRYDVPCADDFSYGTAAHREYLASGSVFRALQAALQQTKDTYFGWQGSFSAVFLMSIQPAVFGLRCYAVTPLLMLFALLGGSFCLCMALLSGTLGLPRALSGCAAALVGLLCVQLAPSPVQGFFWYNGAIYYTFFQGLALAAIALGLELLRKGGGWRTALLCLLALMLGGSNYVTALFCAIVSISSLLLLLIWKNRAGKRLLLPSLCLLAAFFCSMAAPGNAVRQAALSHTPRAAQAIVLSFQNAGVCALRWFRLPLLGALIFLAVLFWPAVRSCRFSFRFPVLVSLYSCCLFSAMFCPPLYAMGDIGDLRLVNILYDAYVLLLVLNLLYWIGWLASRRPPSQAPAGRVSGKPLTAAAALGLVCLLLHMQGGGFTSVMAWGAMRSGEAQAYHAAAMERFAILEDPAVRDAILPPFPCQPYVLYMDDVREDPQDWRNLVMADYYEKDSVVLQRAD